MLPLCLLAHYKASVTVTRQMEPFLDPLHVSHSSITERAYLRMQNLEGDWMNFLPSQMCYCLFSQELELGASYWCKVQHLTHVTAPWP